MDSLQKLIEAFRKFPGIGPRQARRFGFYLLTRDAAYNISLAKLIADVKKQMTQCAECMRFIALGAARKTLCDICRDPARDRSILTIVGTDTDLDAFEKSGTYSGTYFVLGGIVPITESDPGKAIRGEELLELVTKKAGQELKEIILALNANPEGEHTGEYIVGALIPIVKNRGIRISHLGRGLSTGTELEYADPETIKNAIKHRE
ncbi:MAG: recombination protein RecR [Candidatus Taylorbacteria bacterium]|nr:recombination protein RecR [Candidatus Taylorbacteria bacterium]